MAWETPKTNWRGFTDGDGVYSGDRFNAKDFNRIKNNLEHLRKMSLKLYEDFDLLPLGRDRIPADYFYADEINRLEENLQTLNKKTVKQHYGEAPIFADNCNTMDYADLNRLEGAILDIHDRLDNQLNGLRKFTWNFGMRGGDF